MPWAQTPSFSPPHDRRPPQLSATLGVLGQRGEAQVRLNGAQVGEQFLGLVTLDAGVDDDIITGGPVDRGGDLVLVTGLERVNDAEHLGAVAAGRGRVGKDGADGLLGVDDEHRADGEGNALLVNVGGVLVVKPTGISALSLSPRT